MTPAEKIILKWYSMNSFMFNVEDDRFYIADAKENVLSNIQKELTQHELSLSIQQIQQKFKYLRDIFVRTDLKVNNKEDLTYFEKCLYERMFFLKSHISHKGNIKEHSKYEITSSIKTSESAFEASINENKKYLKDFRNNEVLQNKVDVLNDIIKSYPSNETQRLCFLFIIKEIKTFVSSRLDDK